MRDFNTKIDNDNTSAGVVVADEYNSIFGENKNVITPFMGLSEADSQQMIKSIDIVSKAMFYTDAGTPNAVVLERGATTQEIETLFDGMVVMFTPANANTGATTLKIKTLDAKPLYYDGAVLDAGFLATDSKYIAIYDVVNGRFNCDLFVNYKNLQDVIDDVLSVADFENSKTINGYQKLPNGLILQWGHAGSVPQGVNYKTLPIAYPNAHLIAVASNASASTVGSDFGARAYSLTQIVIYQENPNLRSGNWFSIGY